MSTRPLPRFATLGETLRYLRRRARLTQLELSIAVGYSESQISRLEQNERRLDATTLLAVFVPALEIEDQPEVVERLLALAGEAHTPKDENLTAADSAVYDLPVRPRLDAASLTNLPVRLTSFIGREEAITALCQLVSTTRLVTLTGVGGVGKTSLAQAVGSRLAPNFADGTWWVELAPLVAANLVPQAIFAVFKLPEMHDRTYLKALTTYFRDKHLLLILDNCEHLIDECAEVVDLLLRSCPQVHILTTSREVLRVAGEVEWPLSPLAVPKPDFGFNTLMRMQTLLEYESVRLFIERARGAQPEFAWTDQTAIPVASICEQLDGIPLAIELAASRLKGMTVSELAARLDDRFNLLTGGARTSLPRQQTLRAMVDWSYALLSEPERAMLRRLSIFTGGWTIGAAEAIADAQANTTHPIHNPIDVLFQLVNKSLVVVAMGDSQTRYNMLETIRQYAAAKLQEMDEVDAIRARHFTYFLSLAEQLRDMKLAWQKLAVPLDQIEVELGNLRSALAWSREQADGGEQCLRLTAALWSFWSSRGGFQEGQKWLEEALARGAMAPLPLRARAMYGLADLLAYTATPKRRAALAQEALVLCQQVGDGLGIALCHSLLGDAALEQSEYALALEYYRQALHWSREMKLLTFTGVSLTNVADMLVLMGEPAEAMPFCEECFGIAQDSEGNFLIDPELLYRAIASIFQIDRKQGKNLFDQELARQRTRPDPVALASLLSTYGLHLLSTHDPQDLDESIQALSESLELWRNLNIKWGRAGSISRSSLYLGKAYTRKGEPAIAIEYAREAIRLYQEVGDIHGVAWAQLNLGWPALAQGNLALAKTSFIASLKLAADGSSLPYALAGLAETVRQQGNLVRAGRLFGATMRFDKHLYFPDQPVKELPTMQVAYTYLDDPTFTAAWADGEAMTIEQAIAYALE